VSTAKSRRRTRRLGVVAAAVLTVLLAGCAVTPSVPFTHTTFEGFRVISHVPAHPRGMVYLFHGSNGSADFAEKVETVDVLNRLIAQGYGFVSTSSTERTGDRRWNVFDSSRTTNPDLARLARLHQSLVATTPLEATTPLFGIGMSNGARFVTLWGQAWKDASYPVKAIWASMGRVAPPVSAPGALTVPTVFTTAVNDFTVPPAQVRAGYDVARAAGTPTELHVSSERGLSSQRYLRIPGVDQAESHQIFDAFVATGVWDARGVRVISDVEQAAARAATVRLPASVAALGNEIGNQTAVLLAVHQFTAEYGAQVAAFFARR